MWNTETIVPGRIKFTIIGLGSMEEDGPGPLIARANRVAVVLMMRTFNGNPYDLLTFVSANEIKREVTFKLKK
jgi:hypothetical protein